MKFLLWPSTTIRRVPSNLKSTVDIGDVANGRIFSRKFCLSRTGLLRAEINHKAGIFYHVSSNVSKTAEVTNRNKIIKIHCFHPILL